MFFAKTAREAELVELYGFADEFGIDLLNPLDEHALYTEQEERFHGTFLGKTRHGRALLVLGKLRLEPQGRLEDALEFGGAATREPTDRWRAFNRVSFLRQKMKDGSLHAHEALAKFLALMHYTAAYPAKADDHAAFCAEAAGQYPLFASIVGGLGMPLARDDADFSALTLLLLCLGNWTFQTRELDGVARLSDLDAIRRHVMDGPFLDPVTPNLRLRTFVSNTPPDAWQALRVAFSDTEGGVSALVEHCRRILPKAPAPEFDATLDLLSTSVIAGMNIGRSLDLDFWQGWAPFEVQISGDTGMVVGARPIQNVPMAHLDDDVALVVRYAEPFDPKATWVSSTSRDIAGGRGEQSKFICFLGGPANDRGAIFVFVARSSGNDVRYLSTTVKGLKGVRSLLRRLGKERAILCLPRPPTFGVTSYAPQLVAAFANVAPMVSWDPVGRAAALHQADNLFYVPATREELPAWPAIASFAPSPMGLIQVTKIDGYYLPIVGCVPRYWMYAVTREPIRRHARMDLLQEVSKGDDSHPSETDGPYTPEERESIVHATRVYDFIYRNSGRGPEIPKIDGGTLCRALFGGG